VTLRQFLGILRARWMLALSVFVVALGVAAALTFALPKKYSATTSLVLDIKSPDPIAGVLYPAMTMPSYMATQVDIIESDRVALRVVRGLKMSENPSMRSQWQEDTQGAGNFEVWLANLLQKNLDVKPSRESNVVQITFKSVDARFSAAVANAFAQAYVDTTAELRVDPAKQYSSFFDGRAKLARDEVEKAQARLSELQRTKGIINADERFDIETARLSELSSQLVGLQALSAESQSRQTAARRAPNRVVSGLRADLARQEARLQELGARMGDAHPQVVELKANINELRAKLAQETVRLSASVEVTNDINQSRAEQIRASLEVQRAKVLKAREMRDEVAVLQREVEHAQRAYDAVSARLNQSNLESQNTLTNAAVLMPATEAAKPSSPNPVFNFVIAAGVGLLAALAVALLREATDKRVRTLEDISRDMGLPVLGILLGREKRNLLGQKKRHPIPTRLLGRASLRSPRLAAKH
jgi:polysaccharide biosynthesis transport protein